MGQTRYATRDLEQKRMEDQIGAKDVMFGCQHDSFSVNYA